MFSVLIINEAILMSTYNIQFYDKLRKFSEISVFLSYQKKFVWTRKQVRISHGNEPWVFACAFEILKNHSSSTVAFFLFNPKVLIFFLFLH